ncbi:helix-turn-helix transcriptional regulator [Sphingobacterium yanglingense]|uniref:Helix-turn-helix protein n=1 Tax=Sphingobacterium yanglingense TaxID=1437280 RepID=A0A4R6WR29_9SPHI|nr:helix-turn-helix transcriptional regulator [Sphingobacterium yanglingense]TDQ79086.1 helix-turn-helix protein [Sphingobacterium yanglingense]
MDQKHAKYYTRVGKNLKKKRLIEGLTQDQLAKKIPKMDRSKISDMENGKEDFFFSTLLNVCDALNLTLEDATKENVE